MFPMQSEKPPHPGGHRYDRYERIMEKDPISGVWLIEEVAESEIVRVRDENQMYMKAKLCRGTQPQP